jgi:hypothetical protein
MGNEGRVGCEFQLRSYTLTHARLYSKHDLFFLGLVPLWLTAGSKHLVRHGTP